MSNMNAVPSGMTRAENISGGESIRLRKLFWLPHAVGGACR
jgi:hypothetical protein